MPMPHRTFQQVIKRRLTGKEGSARTRELRAILAELPDYRNGPYADLRKWVTAQIGETERRRGATHRDSIAVRRQGAAQIALVGPPNAGKSSLLQALSDVQIRTGDYAFTTTRPVAAATRAGGVLVQLVEIPGLIDGAAEGRGGGLALLSVLRMADAMVLCHDLAQPVARLDALRGELRAAGVDLPALVAATKADEAAPGAADALRRHVAAGALRRQVTVPVVEVSVLDDASLDALREAIWGAHRADPGLAATGRDGRPRSGGPAAAGHGGRRGPLDPPRGGRGLPRRPPVGRLGPLRRSAGGTGPPPGRRRRRGDRDVTAAHTSGLTSSWSRRPSMASASRRADAASSSTATRPPAPHTSTHSAWSSGASCGWSK
jgi:small GTP-binding protein